MLIPKTLPRYHGYLLRFWQEQPLARPDTWRFSLEDPQSGARVGFDGLAELVCFVEEEMHPHGTSRSTSSGAS